jgi:hypothetical protein
VEAAGKALHKLETETEGDGTRDGELRDGHKLGPGHVTRPQSTESRPQSSLSLTEHHGCTHLRFVDLGTSLR